MVTNTVGFERLENLLMTIAVIAFGLHMALPAAQVEEPKEEAAPVVAPVPAVASQLQDLVSMRESGRLTLAQYDDAKAALLGTAAGGEKGAAAPRWTAFSAWVRVATSHRSSRALKRRLPTPAPLPPSSVPPRSDRSSSGKGGGKEARAPTASARGAQPKAKV
jgi:hypothetical protein